MNLDPTFLSSAILLLTGFGGAFLAALWVSLIIWTWRDIRGRSRERLSQILAVLVVGILNLPGLIIYFILRPPLTLEEEYQRTLEEEAMLAAIEDQIVCPGCERRIKDAWSVCPNCHTKLKKKCLQCEQLMELPWNLCPFCGTPAPGMRTEPQSEGDSAFASSLAEPDLVEHWTDTNDEAPDNSIPAEE